MNKHLVALLAMLGIVSAASAAPKLGDFAPLDKKDQGEIVFLYDFEKAGKAPAPYKIVKGEGVTGGGGLVLERPKPIKKYVFYGRNIKGLEPGKFYKLTVMVRAEGIRNSRGELVTGRADIAGFDFSGGGKYLSSNYVRLRAAKGDFDWTTGSITFMMRPEYDKVQLVLFLKKPFTCRKIAWDNVKLEKIGENLSIYPVLPKQLVLDDAGYVKLRVVDVSVKRKLVAFARTPDGKTFCSQVSNGFAEFKLGKQPAGINQVTFFVGDVKAKKIVAERAFPLNVVTAAGPEGSVTTDESGRLCVDGKPFFPVGFYLEWPIAFNAKHAEILRDAGVNTVLPYHSYSMTMPVNKGKPSVKNLRRSLDFLRSYGFKTIFGMLEINTRSRVTLDKFDGAEGREAVIRRIVDGIKDHPGLLAWYISDENPISEMDKVTDLRFRIGALDPYHPVATLTNIPDNYIWFGPTGDFMMIDKYPIRDERDQSMSRIRECFEIQARESRMGMWWVPQGFNWGIYRRGEKYADFRYPTEEEMRAQALLSLNFRARALIFYAYESVRRHDKFDPGASKWFWPRVKAVTLLAKELSPFFLATAVPTQVKLTSKGESFVEAKLHKADDGKEIVVITSDGPGAGVAVLDVGRDGLKSRFGLTKALGNGKYEFRGMNMASDILE